MTPFVTPQEHDALADSARRFVREHYAYPELHASLAAGAGASPQRWRAMAELGWLGIGLAEEAGGMGLGPRLEALLVEELGAAGMPEPLPGQLGLAATLLGAARAAGGRDEVLAGWLAGECIVALADDDQDAAPAAQCRVDGDCLRLSAHKRAVLDAGFATHLLVTAQCEQGPGVLLVPVGASGVRVHAVPSFDGRSVADVELDAVTLPRAALLGLADAAGLLAAAYATHALLLAAEILGAARTLYRVTHDYLDAREQFGVRLASFQALQHRLVDMHLAIVRLESQVLLAAMKAEELGTAAAGRFIAAASAQAAVAGRHVGEEAVQMHGGIGMTDELVVGHLFKRITANVIIGGEAVRRCGAA